MKISQLPPDIREIALQRQRESNDKYFEKDSDELNLSFSWYSSHEGYEIWNDVDNSDFSSFYKFHNITPDKGILKLPIEIPIDEK